MIPALEPCMVSVSLWGAWAVTTTGWERRGFAAWAVVDLAWVGLFVARGQWWPAALFAAYTVLAVKGYLRGRIINAN